MAIDDPTPLPTADPEVLARFLSKVDRTGECWIWTAGMFRDGYGCFSSSRIARRAHRVAWTLFRGPIPDEVLVLHNCPAGDNPRCVNPAHLWLGTQADNMADMRKKGRAATGDKHGSRLHPERLLRGDKHPMRLRPWLAASGDRNGARLHPETLTRGSAVNTARLTEEQVREIRRAAGSLRKIAALFGVDYRTVSDVRRGKTWAHVQ